MDLNVIVIFLIGFCFGAVIIWYLKQKEVEFIQKNQNQLKSVFDDISNEALLYNQKKFLELAEHKFTSLMTKSDKQLIQKK